MWTMVLSNMHDIYFCIQPLWWWRWFLSAILEDVIHSIVRFHEMNSHIFFPFDSNETINTPLAETDPDVQFYSENNYIRNSNCDYYPGEMFNSNLKKKTFSGNDMSFFHVNVKILHKHNDERNLHLNSLEMKFSFLAFNETWINESNHKLYGLPGYHCIKNYRKARKGGGVSLAIKRGISYKVRNY